jgi:hypothetical protein
METVLRQPDFCPNQKRPWTMDQVFSDWDYQDRRKSCDNIEENHGFESNH